MRLTTTKSCDFELNLCNACTGKIRHAATLAMSHSLWRQFSFEHNYFKKAIAMSYSANRNYHEKRNYIRMKIEAPVEMTISSNDAQYSGICRELSGGGMLIELDTTLPVGTHAEVSISSSHGHGPMLIAKAEVTRVIAQPTSSESSCLLGMQITEVLN